MLLFLKKFIVSGLFVVFGAIRLARFNVTQSENEPNVFIGLPVPAAGLLIVGIVLLGTKSATF